MDRSRSLLAWLLSAGALLATLSAQGPATLVLTGATLLDLSNYGASRQDVHDGVVVVRGDAVVAAGPRGAVEIPPDTRTIDASGCFIVPGYFDVFATVNNQAQANAFLYMGVTSIVGSDEPGGRRGTLFTAANPGPRIYRLESVIGYDYASLTPPPESLADVKARGRRLAGPDLAGEVDRLAREGAGVLLLYYSLDPDQVRVAARRARELGLATIGELGSTTYREANEAGVMAFVHTSRYSLDVVPPPVRAAVAAAPFGPSRITFYESLLTVPRDGPRLREHATMLAAGPAALIPTLALNYLDLPDHANPWKEPAAALLDPADIHLPADPATGRPPETTLKRDVMPANASLHLMMLEEVYKKSGAKYLAGSGTDAFGTMPGISLHTELELLVRIGLTPRQALAAATWNVGEVFGWPKVGRIAAGSRADIVVLQDDPTQAIANAKKIRTVILGGRLLDREALLRPARRPEGAAAPPGAHPAAQYPGRVSERYPAEWESDQFRVRKLSIPPRGQSTETDASDAVLVFLTADLDGRMPQTEAAWLPGGARTLENRGTVRFDAILIELRTTPAAAPGPTPPEARPSSDRIAVWRLIDNARVLVAKQRYAPVTSVDPLHFHPHDTAVVYLNGGYTWLPVGQYQPDWYVWPMLSWSRANRVNRGEVELVPANTFHAFGNGGGDPLEFLAIFLR